MRSGRLTLAVLAMLTISSCKITVIVPAGGSVTTSSETYTCAAGQTCDIDVVDFYFDETFTAVPAEGYAFKAWGEGDRRFCGNDPKPCRLLTTGFTGDWVPAIQKFLESSDEVFYLQPIFAPAGDIIPVNGKEWLQPDLFIGLDWNQINFVCPNPDGECSGSLAGRDMTGWTWASVDDVVELFNYYIGRRALDLGDWYSFVFEEFDSAWAPAFFNTGWRPTDGQYGFETVHAFTRTRAITYNNSRLYARYAYIGDSPPGYPPGGCGGVVCGDITGITDFHGTDYPRPIGALFFRGL